MIRKYHNHKLLTNPWHREEEPHNNHETPGRQTKQSNQLSLPYQDNCKTRRDITTRTTKHRTITESNNGSNNKQQINNNRITVGPTGVYLLDFFCSGIQFYLLLSPYLRFISLLNLDLYVLGDDALIS